jgi:hypothetical protein
MECNKPKNLKNCNCTYEPCSRKGMCCECIRYHSDMHELPACCFPDSIEQTYDRSFRTFAQAVMSGKINS